MSLKRFGKVVAKYNKNAMLTEVTNKINSQLN